MEVSLTRAGRPGATLESGRGILAVIFMLAAAGSAALVTPLHAQTPPPAPQAPPPGSQPPAPPAPQSEVVPPSPAPEYVWVPGHWVWRPWLGRYVWIPGYYYPPVQPSHVWVPGHWVWTPALGYRWVEGYWRYP